MGIVEVTWLNLALMPETLTESLPPVCLLISLKQQSPVPRVYGYTKCTFNCFFYFGLFVSISFSSGAWLTSVHQFSTLSFFFVRRQYQLLFTWSLPPWQQKNLVRISTSNYLSSSGILDLLCFLPVPKHSHTVLAL